MRRIALTFTLAVSLIGGAPARAQELTFTFFGDYLESLRRQAGIPGMSAVIVGANEVLWTRAFGLLNVERSLGERTDTPHHVDGLTQLLTSSLVLRCVEEGRLSLTDRVGRYVPDSADSSATLDQLLTHSRGAAGAAVFEYQPERLRPLALAIEACYGESFRATVADLLESLAMSSSVPGVDVALAPRDPDLTQQDVAHF